MWNRYDIKIFIADQVGRTLEGADLVDLAGREHAVVLRARVARTRRAAQPQQHLELAELHRLEARCGEKVLAELEERQRRHSLEHRQRVDEQTLDLRDAREPLQHLAHRAVLHRRAGHQAPDRVQVVDDLLEPQLMSLETSGMG